MSKFEASLGTIIDPGADKPLNEIPYVQCVHCGGHFTMPSFGSDPESKKNRIGRGFCMNCNGFVCGPRCAECKPFERWLEEVEGTKNPTAVSAAVPQGKIWTPGDP